MCSDVGAMLSTRLWPLLWLLVSCSLQVQVSVVVVLPWSGRPQRAWCWIFGSEHRPLQRRICILKQRKGLLVQVVWRLLSLESLLV